MRSIEKEASSRNYLFNKEKICSKSYRGKIEVTSGQVQYEFAHLLSKLKARDEERYSAHAGKSEILVHPIFVVVDGEIETWEVT